MKASLVLPRLFRSAMTTPRRTSKPRTGVRKAHGEPDAVPSTSASLVILAPLSLSERTEGYDYRLLLLKRHATSTAFVSAHVFPGGNLDPIDSSSNAWDSFYPDDPSEAGAKLRSLQLCAIRETFEESGVLLADGNGGKIWDNLPEEIRKDWRDKVHHNGSAFVELFKFLSSGGTPCRPALSLLQYRANWITPRMNSRRFDTHFFIAVLPQSSIPLIPTDSAAPTLSSPLASADGNETVAADWVTPVEAIRRALPSSLLPSSDHILLFPPQFYLCAELAPYKSLAALLSSSASGSPSPPLIKPRTVLPFEPEIKILQTPRGDAWPATVLPGDPEHSATRGLLQELGLDDAQGTRRNRSYVVLPKREEGKKPPPGLTVLGCERVGMEEVLGSGWEDMYAGDIGEEDGLKAKL